ncbi:hypothetical protein WS97_25585 [Burkholderia territorii]|uniref:hypothetical protein n=1 Tax=Burkholderia territorii TaxID=1503055 RepID=UPI00075A9B02|nr:hypothetical protein [Burkholderia territorii]KVL28721.1 hypothetical protein WS97_25585 [Burkholderia territorii]KWO59947.1 hypothetical protein WT98_30920 [Burkholderia territorii]
MLNTRKEIERRLVVLCGLDLSGVNRAADMLTLGFGPLSEVKNFKGVVKHVGKWALHVQCTWRLERTNGTVATREDLCGSDETAHSTVDRLRELLVGQGPTRVEGVSVDDEGGIVISLSGGFSLIVLSDGVKDEEDWRFFAPGAEMPHLVIEGGAVAAESFS